MEAVLETVVRCTEIDVNGHVNNARYVEYLEWGREAWYEAHGFPYDRLLALGAITVVVSLTLNLRHPCHQGDRLRIVTRPQRRGRSSCALAQRIEMDPCRPLGACWQH
jgi:YbgC/YbaW family acyl-CoA thioester hydrolase